MENAIPSATLCPVRSTDSGIEVLLTRRAFWNAEQNRPMRYPGEWIFSGGKHIPEDGPLCNTAIREFREELRYLGNISKIALLRSDNEESIGTLYYIEFYLAKLSKDPQFSLSPEVIDFRWMRPGDASALLRSEYFTIEQQKEFQQRKLDNPEYGKYATSSRQFPVQTAKTLDILAQRHDLRGQY
jgi:8-oxo-dGTP pyrophosphatase MutT (NUDIX family)